MTTFYNMFIENNSNVIEYKGNKVHRFLKFEEKGIFIFKFKFISTNSIYQQAIHFHLSSFNGKIYLDDTEIKKPKRKFPQIIFSEKYSPKEFSLKVQLDDGHLTLCNSADLLGDEKIWRSLYDGCAMIIEELGENHYLFKCNDYENDDDFDDLIFELQIIKVE